jgi:hypothetical protein
MSEVLYDILVQIVDTFARAKGTRFGVFLVLLSEDCHNNFYRLEYFLLILFSDLIILMYIFVRSVLSFPHVFLNGSFYLVR